MPPSKDHRSTPHVNMPATLPNSDQTSEGQTLVPQKLSEKLSDYEQTHPEQLLLFYDEHHNYSRSIELYDAIPKYFWGRLEREHGKYLPTLKREFVHKNVHYTVMVSPARLEDKDGQEKEFLPGQREELVEDALRKLACEGKGVFLDAHAGVVFSLYELEKELQRMGHGYNKNQLKEALLICGKTSLMVESDDGKILLMSAIFPAVGLQTRHDWQTPGPKTQGFVCFNPLVTNSIRDRTFRPINYEKCMAYKSTLARWFHKRLSHNYIGASFTTPFSILLTTVIRDSGMKEYDRLSGNLREVKEALEEMQAAEVISKYSIKKIFGERRNMLVDAKLVLFPHLSFVQEMKQFNHQMTALNQGNVALSEERREILQQQRQQLLREGEPENL